jgi:magnesium chelatase subunit D
MSDRTPSGPDPEAIWADAVVSAALFAVDPQCLGVVLRSRAGPVRERYLGILRHLLPTGAPVRRVPIGISDDRLIGGLDLSASIAAQRAIVGAGILAESNGGVVILAMAENIDRPTAARIAAAYDDHEIAIEREGFSCRLPSRFGIVALDESVEVDERPPYILTDRLGFHVELDGVSLGASSAPNPISNEDIVAARAKLPEVEIDDEFFEALCTTAMALGVASLRAPLLAIRAAAAHAALHGRSKVEQEDAAAAARLVLAPRATILPASEESEEEAPPPDEEPPPPPEPPQNDQSDQDNNPTEVEKLEDMVLAAAQAAIPKGLLARLLIERAGLARAKESGRSGAVKKSVMRGRPAGVRYGRPHSGARLHLIETLRAAAPWQRVRRPVGADGMAQGPISFRPDDFRIRRHVERAQTTTIFVVDASGSSALNRLAEAKGAVELLLADCYVRRDRVALISFRNKTAELVLPPTRSLARAKRCLSAMPGGGGTPIAAALNAATTLATSIASRGGAASIVVMTDGRANIAMDGSPGRARANEDALAEARQMRISHLSCALIDTSPHPQPTARALADAMGAIYLPLPHADAAQVSGVVRAATQRSSAGRARAS